MLEGTLKGHLVHPSCSTQGYFALDQAAQILSNLTFSISRNGAFTISLGNLLLCFTTLIIKELLSQM